MTRMQEGIYGRLQPDESSGMELGNAGFVYAQAVGNLLHGQLLLVVESDDLALTLPQVGEGAAMFGDADYLRTGVQTAFSPAEVLQRVELVAKI